MDKNPIQQFREWFGEATAAGLTLPEAACLSTVSPEGLPEGRMILLKGADEGGFVFYTNLESAKARSLEAHPHAALTFYWEPFRRQVRIQGKVTLVSDAEADAYFRSRPRDSQLGAWASHQSEPLDSSETLGRRYGEFEKKFMGQEVPRPPHWGGYRIIPETVEFWIERPHRLHDRFLYTRQGSGWVITRLSP